MKLQKHRTRKDKDYSKYVIVIPTKIIKDAKLKEGDDLDFEIKNGEVMLRKK